MKSNTKQDIIFGKRPVLEALQSGVELKSVSIADTAKSDALLNRIVELLQKKNVRYQKISARDLRRIAKDVNTQGIVAHVAPFKYANIEDVVTDDMNRLVVVCDHITDVGNLGAIIRSAESVGATCVVIPNARSASVTSIVYKTSAGAVSHIPISQVSNIVRTLEFLKDQGFWVVGATEHAENLMWDANFEGRIALVLGNEEKGISDLVLKTCDDTFKLPQLGDISSLNVAQASTVFMYEWVRQNGFS